MTRDLGRAFAATAATVLAIASSACGYRIVHNTDATAKRFAQDSAQIATLRNEYVALQLKCHADSVSLANQLAVQTESAARAAAAPQSDSLLKVRTAEVASLRDQLAKVSAELDRIKRRLANPRG